VIFLAGMEMPLAVRRAETERENFLLLLPGLPTLPAGTLLTCLQRNGFDDLLLRCIVGTAAGEDVHCLAGSTARGKTSAERAGQDDQTRTNYTPNDVLPLHVEMGRRKSL
jgi:hypothetical protein